jgi:hypothetical protein
MSLTQKYITTNTVDRKFSYIFYIGEMFGVATGSTK